MTEAAKLQAKTGLSSEAPVGLDVKPEEDGYHQGKDGKWYTYQTLSVANRLFLAEKFELDKLKELYPNKKNLSNKKRKKASTTTPQKTTPIAPSRRSGRLRNVTPDNPKGMSEIDFQAEKELEAERNKRYKPSVNKTTTKRPKKLAFSDEELAKLEQLPQWIQDLNVFLRDVDQISVENRRRALQKVELLATGVGITYHHWPRGKYFCKGLQIDMSYDFDKLYDQAQAMENKYGRDLGNGWLMRHPLVKLKNFQQYLLSEKKGEL